MNTEREDVKRDGGPELAFAALATSPMGDVHHQPGMTLRDWFAGQALAMTAPAYVNLADSAAILARRCYAVADAMLDERSRAALSRSKSED